MANRDTRSPAYSQEYTMAYDQYHQVIIADDHYNQSRQWNQLDEWPLPTRQRPEIQAQQSDVAEDSKNSTLEVKPIQKIERDLKTRNWSCVTLVLGWCIGIGAIAAGARVLVTGQTPVPDIFLDRWVTIGTNFYPFPTPAPGEPPQLWLEGHRAFVLPEVLAIIMPLLFNIFLNVVLDGINYIPSTTLRWALRLEGSLSLNSNPRLFTSASNFLPNSWFINIISAVALVLSYGGTSVMVFHVYIIATTDAEADVLSYDVPGPRYGIDINAWGCIGMGIGVLIQSIISTWCLLRSGRIVPSWSSNFLGTARACIMLEDERFLVFRNSRAGTPAMPPSITPNGSTLCKPESRQPSMTAYASQARLIGNLVWAVASIIAIWTITVGIISRVQGSTTLTWVKAQFGNASALSFWETFGQISIQYANPNSPYIDRKDWLGLIIQCLILSIITLGLHLVEFITHTLRDEIIWRRATTVGVNPDDGVIRYLNWPYQILFVLKALIHWMFGYAFNTDILVYMNLLPMLAITVSLLILGIFTEVMLRWKPKGSQPATYGDIRRLIVLVDEWNYKRIYWGDKGVACGSFRKAGSAGHQLDDLDMDAEYVNLYADPLRTRL